MPDQAPKPGRLKSERIQDAVLKVPAWQLEGETIHRTYALSSFRAALAFVQFVGELAEDRDHHPDIDINRAAPGSRHPFGLGGTNRDRLVHYGGRVIVIAPGVHCLEHGFIGADFHLRDLDWISADFTDGPKVADLVIVADLTPTPPETPVMKMI